MSKTRNEYEKRVMEVMVGIYCRRRHGMPNGQLCMQCSELLDYSMQRIEHCPKGGEKTSCRRCEIHCYSPHMRERVREVMRHVGPRMIFIHPVMAVRHLYYEMK